KATQQVFEVGKNIASLQEILSAPKLRGSLGELFLGEILSQMLPPTHFTLQYRFKNNEAVDAVILLGPALVSVDSKFPLENFKKVIESGSDEEKKAHRKKFLSDVKKHVDNISAKYILPDEGTYDFALMYIPAENVYYETIIKDEAFGDDKSLCSYALSKRVIPVSPNSFYAYLQAIVLGFKGLRIEKSAQEIHQRLQRLSGDFYKFKEDFDVIGKHLSNTRGKYEEASKKLDRFGDRLLTVDQEEPERKGVFPKEEVAKPALFD
ncbi:MAG TPA: DNA recombination protein RmuC, partial [Candidatus Manganitrophaceae bacterium]|nr:DNA recombination protein RmuC [Candidatus Manganitrophaceae bacterium]